MCCATPHTAAPITSNIGPPSWSEPPSLLLPPPLLLLLLLLIMMIVLELKLKLELELESEPVTALLSRPWFHILPPPNRPALPTTTMAAGHS